MRNSLDISSGYRKFYKPWWKHYFSWRTYRNASVFTYQRITRGWADCDVWGIDSTLARIIPEMVTHLKTSKQGIPSIMFPDNYDDSTWKTNPEKYKADRAFVELRWEAILNDIILGFKSYQDIQEHNWPPEFKEKLATSTGWHKQIGINDTKYDWEAIKAWEKAKTKDFKRGMHLLTEYFGCMWD